MSLLKFGVVLLVVALVCFCGGYYLVPARPSFVIETTLFLFLVTMIIYRYLYARKDPQLFTTIYLATLAFKILIYGGYAIAIILLDRQGSVENVIYFLLTYVLFTAFEVGFLYQQISGKS
jgi:hypothetical protein